MGLRIGGVTQAKSSPAAAWVSSSSRQRVSLTTPRGRARSSTSIQWLAVATGAWRTKARSSRRSMTQPSPGSGPQSVKITGRATGVSVSSRLASA